MHTASAPAKLNFGLHVLRMRADGFRDIDTVFVRIPWCDVVSVESAEGLSMTCSDPSLPTDGRNLCLRAAQRLIVELGAESLDAPSPGRFGARIHLDKRVPYGAGLGSGSSDAATTLRLLCRLWGVEPAPGVLHDIALGLGSDVPFFLYEPAARGAAGVPAASGEGIVPVARGAGRGEVLTPVEAPGLRGLNLVVAVPPVHVATGPAYAMVEPRDDGRPDPAAIVASCDLPRWRRELVNDFQGPIARAYPAIGAAMRSLERSGAEYTSLSGSGSSVFGVFTNPDAADRAAQALRDNGLEVWSGRPGDPAAA